MNDPERMIEIACVELIQRRRNREPVRTEEFLERYPCLVPSEFALDLIDAELCVRQELGEPDVANELIDRFPQYASAIRQLVAIDTVAVGSRVNRAETAEHTVACSLPHAQSNSSQSDSPSDSSGWLSIDIASRSELFTDSNPSSFNPTATTNQLRTVSHRTTAERRGRGAGDADGETTSDFFVAPPIRPPRGFVIDSGVVASPGQWLFRCHDTKQHQSFALKVLPGNPGSVTKWLAEEKAQRLDAIERAARIVHPGWVAPVAASCDESYVSVVRPWVHGISWDEKLATLSNRELLARLSEIAFCLAAVHRQKCFHGRLQSNNLWFGHESQLLITDGGLDSINARDSASAETRDVTDFLRLVACAQASRRSHLDAKLVVDVHKMIDGATCDTMLRLGEWFIHVCDRGTYDRSTPRADTARGGWRRMFRRSF